jgi:hypothetical protein
VNHPKDLASEIEAQFASKVNQNGELLRDSAAAARMRILEEERNAAVLEAERARKERDCAMAREKVALEQPVCEYRARFHDECRRNAEQVEAWAAERGRLKAALDCALERERARLVGSLEQPEAWAAERDRLKAERDRLKAERDRLKASLEDVQARVAGWGAWASRALALENELNKTRAEAAERESGLLGLLDNERVDHEVTREALALASAVVGDLLAGVWTREPALNALSARIRTARANAAAADAADATAKGEP